MEKKKGLQLSQAFGAVLVVVLVAILVIIALVIFGSLGAISSESATNLNETGGFINETGYTLDNATACNFANPVISNAGNATTAIILSGNWTISDAGVVTNASIDDWVNVVFNYTYEWGGSTCDAAESMVTQFATYPVLVGLVGTIIFLGLVIGVLVASFVFGGRRRV